MGRKSNEQIERERAEQANEQPKQQEQPKVQPVVSEQKESIEDFNKRVAASLPQKVAPVITERAQPKITQVSRPVINNKKWYLLDKSTGRKAQMSQNQAQKTATKYPQQFSAIYE